MISPTANNLPHVDNVTGDIAKMAGRYVEAGIEGLQVDLSNYASDGTLGLTTATGSDVGSADVGNQALLVSTAPLLSVAQTFSAKPYATQAAAISSGLVPPAPGETKIIGPVAQAH